MWPFFLSKLHHSSQITLMDNELIRCWLHVFNVLIHEISLKIDKICNRKKLEFVILVKI